MKTKLPQSLEELATIYKTLPRNKRKTMLRWKCPTNLKSTSNKSEAKQ